MSTFGLDVTRLKKRRGGLLLLLLLGLDPPVAHIVAKPLSGLSLGALIGVRALEMLHQLRATEHIHPTGDIDSDRSRHNNPL